MLWFLGFLLQAIFIVSIGYAESKHTAVILLTLGLGLGGFSAGGLGVNIIDISPRYAGFIMGISNCISCLPGMLGPQIVGLLTESEVSSVKFFS